MITDVRPRSSFAEARGLRFHYVEWGEANAPPIVLLHGMSAMCRIWDKLGLALQDRYRLLALDQRGHGDTSWPEPPQYATDDFVADLEAMIDIWGLERFALIGLSMGGFNAMAYAASHLDRVTHLVPVDIRPAINPDKRPGLEMAKKTAENGHPTFGSIDEAFAVRKLIHPYTSDAAIRHHVEHLCRQLPDGRWTYKHDPRVGYYWRPGNLWKELPKIGAPALIVRGGRSEVLPQAMAVDMRAAFPNAHLVTIEESGHTVPEDQPEQFIEAVETFLGANPV
jgi:pimeloyl-ACP methyl ester carboxylesterase